MAKSGEVALERSAPAIVRDPILATAMALLDEAGLAGCTLSAIADRLGISVAEVEKQLDAFREQHQRDLHWFTLADASDIVDEPELSTALRKLEGRVSLAA